MKRLFLLLAIALFSVWASAASAAPALEGGRMKFDFSDSSWTLTHSGVGEVLPGADGVEGAVLQLTGNGDGSSAWVYANFPFDQVREASPSGLGMFRSSSILQNITFNSSKNAGCFCMPSFT